MELRDQQYQSGLRLAKGAEEALRQLVTSLRRKDEADRIRRGIEEVETIMKKVKRELRMG